MQKRDRSDAEERQKICRKKAEEMQMKYRRDVEKRCRTQGEEMQMKGKEMQKGRREKDREEANTGRLKRRNRRECRQVAKAKEKQRADAERQRRGRHIVIYKKINIATD